MLTSIQIDRFKSLHHSSLVKLGRVNLLTGANGRGKSSFCQSLLALSQTWRRGMMDSLLPAGAWKDLGTFNDIVYAYDENRTIGFHLVTDAAKDNDFELLYKQSELNNTLGELLDAKVGGISIKDKEGSSGDGMGEDEEFDNEEKDSEFRLVKLRDFKSLVALEKMFYVAAERKAAPAFQPLDETTPNLYLAPDGSNVLNVLWKNKEDGCIKKVQALLERVLDGGSLLIDLAGDRLVLGINSVSDGHLFQPVNVGYGYSYILSLLTSVALANEGSIIIVENPEAHLHPAAQAKMMNLLIETASQRDVQLIVETHSDHVLNTALRAVKEERLLLDDLKVLFFTNQENENGYVEANVQNLEVNQLGHIINPPQQFFEQYSLDLRALYAPPVQRRYE